MNFYSELNKSDPQNVFPHQHDSMIYILNVNNRTTKKGTNRNNVHIRLKQPAS